MRLYQYNPINVGSISVGDAGKYPPLLLTPLPLNICSLLACQYTRYAPGASLLELGVGHKRLYQLIKDGNVWSIVVGREVKYQGSGGGSLFGVLESMREEQGALDTVNNVLTARNCVDRNGCNPGVDPALLFPHITVSKPVSIETGIRGQIVTFK